uniref:hypothetical protein n=1 Tax=Acinetobacter sp. CFCC 10889 TaxID=1775557 RepID=UPI000DD0D18E
MELQNLRLQALHIAEGNIEKAQAIESYVLGQKAEKVVEPQEQPVPTNLGVSDVKPTDEKG